MKCEEEVLGVYVPPKTSSSHFIYAKYECQVNSLLGIICVW